MVKDSFVKRATESISNVLGHYTTLEIASGKGCYLKAVDGTHYLDFSSGVAVTSTGHCHPHVVRAIQKQAETLIHACFGVAYYGTPIVLAEKLQSILDNHLNSFYFCQSGTEAVEAALKLCKYVSKKPSLLAFKGGFHGRSLGALSLTSSNMKYRSGYEPLLKHQFLSYPNLYHWPDEIQLNKQASRADKIDAYNRFLDQSFKNLDPDIGGVIIEPFLGEGGYVPAPKEVLQHLNALCKKHGLLFILDEIQSGFGRTGNWFIYQDFALSPDILIMAKGMGSGLPIGGIATSKTLMDQWTTGSHGGTYGANPVCCAAANATIDVLEPTLPEVKRLGDLALSHLKEKLLDHPRVGDIRGKGFMIGIEFVTEDNQPDPDFTKTVLSACLKEKLILISCGNGEVIRFLPPLITDETTLMAGLNILIEAIYANH